MILGEKAFTAAHDGQMALEADELQYERGYGPCMDAGRAGQVFLIHDMSASSAGPTTPGRPPSAGSGSSLSVPLPFQGAMIGALNTYSGHPHAFGDDDLVLAQEMAAWIALAVEKANAETQTAVDLATPCGWP